jgi:hypothetical protein
MDIATFKKAVDSLDDYSGTVGIIGGEPTLHPEFEQMALYLRKKRLPEVNICESRQPIGDFQKHIYDHLIKDINIVTPKVGLWSSLNIGYYRHFETINDNFGVQFLNDHDNACQHQALLIARKELNIPNDEWQKKRDACWIQNTWSATITPKGAFFCEVAGSLDMLFNGPGGKKIEPHWWDWEPEDFGEQLNWCEMCSACLDVPQRISSDGRDDMTPLIYEKLKKIGSPKVIKGNVVVHSPVEFDKGKYKTFTGDNDYMDAGGGQRASFNNRNLYPKNFCPATNKNWREIISDSHPDDWVVIAKYENKAIRIGEKFKDYIINPGCLYEYDGAVVFNVLAHSIRNHINSPMKMKKCIKSYYPTDKIIKINNMFKDDGIGNKLSFIQKIFSITNECQSDGKKYKIICIFGIRIKSKSWRNVNNEK